VSILLPDKIRVLYQLWQLVAVMALSEMKAEEMVVPAARPIEVVCRLVWVLRAKVTMVL
jgi:hypothetical protein